MTSIGFLSTFPPTRCGLATFTASLADAMTQSPEVTASIVRVMAVDEPSAAPGRGARAVAGHLMNGDTQSVRDAAAILNRTSVAIIQHEYGIYGGRDGAEVLGLLDQLTVPAIVVLHTVLATPSPHQRVVLEAVCAHASFVVVMTQHARETLPPRKVRVIPHGARTPRPVARATAHRTRPTLLTWGLISPGKGLEWSIRAVADLAASGTVVDYVIAGQTHPKLVAEHGEGYRDALTELVGRLGLREQVTFVDRYLTPAALDSLIGAADAVVLPYESADQATSGVLAEAVAARVPVVATGFPHAVELLAGGAGIVVPHRDPAAIAAAVTRMLRSASTPATGSDATSWTNIGRAYLGLVGGLLAERAA